MPGLSRASSLRGRNAFSGVISRGSSITTGSIKLFYVCTGEAFAPKTGFSVSRRIHRAAIRNRIKRCLREAYRSHKTKLPRTSTAGVKMVFLYRGENVKRSSAVRCKPIENDMSRLLESLTKRLLIK